MRGFMASMMLELAPGVYSASGSLGNGMASPRTRGSTPFPEWGAVAARGFPAPAGIDPRHRHRRPTGPSGAELEHHTESAPVAKTRGHVRSKKGAEAPSEQALFGEAHDLIAGDDQVIEDADVDQ